jgi:DNA-binding response OmpR family regulator
VRRVLVADEDRHVLSRVRALLRAEDLDVVAVDDGNLVFPLLDREDFDLVILDIFMRGVDGLDTIRLFRKRHPNVPVIAMSALEFPETSDAPPDFLAMATRLGAKGGLRKPFEARHLQSIVRACLDPVDC